VDIDIYDMPGFDDNRGQDIDIKNALDIQKIIKTGSENESKMKLVLLIDYNMLSEQRSVSLLNLL
jgi:hypothetical protein